MPDDAQVLVDFQRYLAEFAGQWYQFDEARAFKHVAFTCATGTSASDEAIREMTGISKPGAIEICGWWNDPERRTFTLFQATGWNTKVDEAKLAAFWDFPAFALADSWREDSAFASALAAAGDLEQALRAGHDLRLTFASRGGYTGDALEFGRAHPAAPRVLTLSDGAHASPTCCLTLLDEQAVADAFYGSTR